MTVGGRTSAFVAELQKLSGAASSSDGSTNKRTRATVSLPFIIPYLEEPEVERFLQAKSKYWKGQDDDIKNEVDDSDLTSLSDEDDDQKKLEGGRKKRKVCLFLSTRFI